MKHIKKTLTLYLVLPDGTKKIDRITIDHKLSFSEKEKLENGIRKAVLVPLATYATMAMTAIGLYDLTSIYISTSSYTDDNGNTKVPTGAAAMGLFAYFVGGTVITMAAGDAVSTYVEAKFCSGRTTSKREIIFKIIDKYVEKTYGTGVLVVSKKEFYSTKDVTD